MSSLVKTSLRVQEIRKKLLPHLKAAKDEKKKSTMVSDHLLINRKKFILDEGNNLQQKAQEVGRPVNEKNQCTVKGDYIAKGNTCLLYTSPSPRDSGISRMPSSA